MKSQFFIAPSIETVVEESADILNTGRPLVSFDAADINAIAKEASNVVLLEGYANGSCRISNAIEDAIAKYVLLQRVLICSPQTKYSFISVIMKRSQFFQQTCQNYHNLLIYFRRTL